jgi:outer membrane protein
MATATHPRSRRLARVIVAAALWLGSNATAQDAAIRVGYVDMQRVINESTIFTVGRQQLTQEFEARNQALQLEQARLRALETQRDRELGSLSAIELAELRTQIETLASSIQRRRTELTKALNQRMTDMTARIDRRVREEIGAFARAEGYDLVLTDGVGFANPRLDVTEAVLKRVNARAEEIRTP